MKTIIAGIMISVMSMSGFGIAQPDLMRRMSTDEKIGMIKTMNMQMTSDAHNLNRNIAAIRNLTVDAMKSTGVDDICQIIAEVFATAPEYALPYVTDVVSTEIANRRNDGSFENNVDFKKKSIRIMFCVYRRCRSGNMLDISNQRRIVFAVIAFLKASGDISEDFKNRLLAFVPDTVRESAKNEWIPCALGTDKVSPTYVPLCAAATNDEHFAKMEKNNDDVRLLLKYPAPEQQPARVVMTENISMSTLLLVPKFEDEPENISNRPAKYGYENRENPYPPEPSPYAGQCLCL